MIEDPGYLMEIEFSRPMDLRNSYPFNIPSIKNLNSLKFHPRVTYLIGENGLGKSTLLEAIAVYLGFNAEGGSKNFNFKTRSSHSSLHEHIKIIKSYRRIADGFFLRGESFYNVASEIDAMEEEPFGGGLLKSYGGTSLHELSHGESFWALFMNRFGGNGLYILDEPESALSIQRQMAMLSKIHQLVNQQSQLIIATHSPVLLAYPDSVIYQLTADGIQVTPYKETEVYSISKAFLNNPEQMLEILLK